MPFEDGGFTSFIQGIKLSSDYFVEVERITDWSKDILVYEVSCLR